MEGGRRGRVLAATLLAGCALIAAASGCGGDDSSAVGPGAIETADPQRTFAPLLEIAPDEPWRPMGARWFIERSLLGVAADCEDRPVAVGRTLPERRNEATNWIFLDGLGRARRTYYRNPYDAQCELDFDRRLTSDQLTRPHDPGPRLDGLSSDQGFYLDLADEERHGPAIDGQVTAPVYVERTDEGDSGVRLTYWTLYGMHGAAGEPTSHEGDWERVDVLLRADGDRYEPLAVQLRSYGYVDPDSESDREVAGAGFTETKWSDVQPADGTHPVIRIAREIHNTLLLPAGASCYFCRKWRSWNSLEDARDQLWYGFGGAWGEVGGTAATTGPLGPHGPWPTAADKERDLAAAD